MRHVVAVLGVWAVAIAVPAHAQVVVSLGSGTAQEFLTKPFDGPKPTFEVASVRPNTASPDGSRLALSSTPGRFVVAGLPLQMVLSVAYRLRPDQTEGLPDWVKTSRFDISAKMPDGAPQEQMPYMLQSLLEDRFKLKWHTETREADIYALVVARDDGRLGSKLKKSDMDCKPIIEKRQAAIKEALSKARGPQDQQAAIAALLPKPGEPLVCNTNMSMAPTPGGPPVMTLRAAGVELTTLISLISSMAGRPVVDQTNLTGGFDFEFSFSPLGARGLTTALPGGPPAGFGAAAGGAGAPAGLGAPVPSAVDDAPTVFQAVEEQLGLKLRSTRGPVEYFVVDDIQQPEAD